MTSRSVPSPSSTGCERSFVPGKLRDARAFWLGVVVLTVGVSIQAVDFLVSRHSANMSSMATMGMAGMLGMFVNAAGLILAILGAVPAGLRSDRINKRSMDATTDIVGSGQGRRSSDIAVAAMDGARLTGAHGWMIVRLFVGLVFDTMKPATIAFMLPGLRAEYHLAPAQASLLPLLALTGTTLGSIVFGRLGDVIGRRSSLIITALILASTAFCGLMPTFVWQLAMCFVMGLAAGGELPLIYSMLVEMMPTRHRGWSSVMIGGVGGLCGYLLASLAALTIEPVFTWRALWLPNIPTALIMLLLVRLIPESPRLLLHAGHPGEARMALRSLGLEAEPAAFVNPSDIHPRGVTTLFRAPFVGTTVTLGLYGLAYGIFNWGFITWLPTMLRDVLHYDPTVVTRLLATSAVYALPGTIAAAALYSMWSSRGAAVLFALLTGAIVGAFGLAQPIIATRPDLMMLAVTLLLITSSSMIGILAPYSAEMYPTALRGTGSGVVAASSKVGGIVGPPAVGTILTLTIASGLFVSSVAVSLPLLVAGFLMAARGVETRGRRLEELA